MTEMSNEPDLTLEQNFYPAQATLFDELMQVVTWDESMNARKTASCGKPYDYSQMNYETTKLLPCLLPAHRLLVDRLGVPFNNCLMNLYETGRNTMGFHADDTGNLVSGSGVAIISLGGERTITFRSMDESVSVAYALKPGSLLYMGTDVQDGWKHSIRKQENAEPRISLTWRAIQ